MLENVKALVGKKFKPQFDEWIEWLDGIGYNTYWQILNAKDYGVPQNRERVFAISIRKDVDDGGFRFPEKSGIPVRLRDVLESVVDEKYYLSETIVQGFVAHNERHEGRTGFVWKPRDLDGIANTLRANSSLCPTDNTIEVVGHVNRWRYESSNRIHGIDGISPTVTTITGSGQEVKIAEPEAYGALLQPIDRNYNKHGSQRETHIEVLDEPVPYALRANNHCAMVVRAPRIRKLTPLECWRLMGFSDEAFRKAEAVCSNSQLYKQAGNSIVVDVLVGIFRNLFKED